MTSTAENVLARCKRLLAEKEAKLVSWSSVSIARNTTPNTPKKTIRMTRRWEKIDDLIRADLEDYLKKYTSVSNNEVESIYVNDPWADGEKRDGRWKLLRVYSSPTKTIPNEQGIYQTLLYWPADEDGDIGELCAESSPLHHDDVEVFSDSATLADCNHVNSVGHIYSATNRLDPETGLWSGEKHHDQSRKIGPKTSYSGSQLVGVERKETRNDDSPDSPQRGGVGVRTSENFSINQYGKIDWGTVKETAYPVSGYSVVYGSVLSTTTAAEGKNADSPVSPLAGAKGTITGAKFNINEFAKIDWGTTHDVANVYSAVSSIYGGTLSKITHQEGRNAQVQPNPLQGNAGYINSAQFNINQYGLFDWSTTVEQGIYFPGPLITTGGPYEKITHREFKNDTHVSTPAVTGSNYVRCSYTINQYGLYDWSYDIVEPNNAGSPATSTFGSVLETVTVTEGKNASAPKNPLQGGVGTINREQFNINQYGLIDWTTTAETGRRVQGPDVTYTNKYDVATHSEVKNDNVVPNQSNNNGYVRGSYSINQYGLYDWSKESIIPVTGVAAVTTTYGSATESVTLKEGKNAATPLNQGRGGIGIATQESFSINQYGLIDWSATTESAIPVTGPTVSYGGKMERTSHSEGINSASVPTASTSYGIVGRSYNINKYGLYNWSLDVAEPTTNLPEVTSTYGGPVVSVASKEKRNSTTAYNPGNGAAGIIHTAGFSINKYGLIDTSQTTETAIEIIGTPLEFGGPMVGRKAIINSASAQALMLEAGAYYQRILRHQPLRVMSGPKQPRRRLRKIYPIRKHRSAKRHPLCASRTVSLFPHIHLLPESELPLLAHPFPSTNSVCMTAKCGQRRPGEIGLATHGLSRIRPSAR